MLCESEREKRMIQSLYSKRAASKMQKTKCKNQHLWWPAFLFIKNEKINVKKRAVKL